MSNNQYQYESKGNANYRLNNNSEWVLIESAKKNFIKRKEQDDELDMKSQKIDNYKKILCKNVNTNKKCIYGNKCLYAHSLDEQNVDPIRKTAYEMIKEEKNLSEVDLSKNKNIYNTLLSLTKICPHCEEGKCTGGYNCKHGACDKKYVICVMDLNKGKCNGQCGKIHLTKKGLISYGESIIRNMSIRSNIPKPKILDETFFKKIIGNNEKKEDSDSESDNDNDEWNFLTNIKKLDLEINQDLNKNNFDIKQKIDNNDAKILRSIFDINFELV